MESLHRHAADSSAALRTVPDRIISVCLFFLLAVLPLLVNPLAYDYYYQPKIESVYALILIIIAAAGIRHVSCRPVRVRFTPLTIPLSVFALSAVISTVFSIAPRLSLWGDIWRLEGMFTQLSYVGLVFIFDSLVESEAQFHRLIKGLLLSSAIVALYGIVQYAGFNPTEHFDPLFRHNRINSTIGNTNFLGKFLVLVLPLLLAYYLTAAGRAARLMYAAGMMLCSCTLMLTFTRASWFGCGAALLVFGLLAGPRMLWGRKKQLGALAGAALAAVSGIVLYASVISYTPQGQRFFSIQPRIASSLDLKEGKGVATRLFVWRKVVGLIAQRPLLGYGPDTHVIPMSTFNLEYIRKFNDRVIIDRAHNNYLDIAIAQGLLGLGAYLAVIIAFMIWLYQAIKTEHDASRRILWCGIGASFAGYLINDFFIFSVVSVSPTFWSLMGAACALRAIERG